MTAATTALTLGALAGLSVAMPVGPVGALLLREGLVHGTRVAVGAAAGVATVDAGYAVLAVAAGAPLGAAVAAHETPVRLVSAAVLLVVGALGLLAWWRARSRAAAGDADAAVPASRPLAAYGRFVALTAVNPLTLLIFATVAVGLVARVGAGAGASSAVAFVVGVAGASLAWQLVLAVASGALGARLGPAGRSTASLLGSLVVVLLAGVVAAG